MNKICSLASIAVLAMTIGQQAQADVLVDTGAPNMTGFPLVLDGSDWLAAEFTIGNDWQINDINAYMSSDGNQAGTTFNIVIYDNNSVRNLPDMNGQEFSQQATYGTDGWNGVTGINNLTLHAGSYWVAFEVDSSASNPLQAALPVYVANAMQATAWGPYNFGYHKATGNDYNFGVQINGVSAVPVPPSLLLFGSGLLAVARFAKRKTA
jgi:hypothetical protein